MLYMAGGGRISRVHGPFVSDDEVEKVVRASEDAGRSRNISMPSPPRTSRRARTAKVCRPAPMGEEGGDLYDRAVAIVLRDRKVLDELRPAPPFRSATTRPPR